MIPFDRTLAHADDRWTLLVKKGRRVVCSLTPPNPYSSVEQWLIAEGVDPGKYSVSLCAGDDVDDKKAAREELGRYGPLRATFELGDSVAFAGDDDDEPLSPASAANLRAEQEAITKAAALRAQLDLDKLEEEVERRKKGQAAGMTSIEVALLNRLEKLEERLLSQAHPASDTSKALELMVTMMQAQATAAQRQNTELLKILMNASPGTGVGAGKAMGELKQMFELMKVFQEQAGQSQQPQTEIGAALQMATEFFRAQAQMRQLKQGLPLAPGQTPPAPPQAPQLAPPEPQPAQDAQTQGPAPEPAQADLSRQRVQAFVEVILQELRNETLPDETAWQVEQLDVYKLLPGPLLKALEAGDLQGTLAELQKRLDPTRWDQLRDLVTTDTAAREWLGGFLKALSSDDGDDDPDGDGTPLHHLVGGAAANGGPNG